MVYRMYYGAPRQFGATIQALVFQRFQWIDVELTPMDAVQIKELLAELDGTKSDDAELSVVRQLRLLGSVKFVELMLDLYRKSTKLNPRLTAVYYTMPYARENETAVEIGKLAVFDKSKKVRFRGCQLLAYSLRKDVVEVLLRGRLKVGPTEQPDFDAAIDAIRNQNHHYFHDRNHSGMITWEC